MRQKLRGIILAAVMLACAVPAVAYASAPDSGTLSIIFEKEDSNIKIDGASVAVYKIADMEPVGNTAVYTMLKQYSSFATMKGSEDVTFNGMTASASNDLAKRMSTAVSGPAAKGVTDKNGMFKTGKLPAGMYLVGQTGKSGTAEKYKAFDPFLISVPLFEGGTWNADVVAQPKTSVEEVPDNPDQSGNKPTPTPSNGTPSSPGGSPGSSSSVGGGPGDTGVNRQASSYQTGDIAMSGLLGAMLAAAVVLVFALVMRRRQGKKEE